MSTSHNWKALKPVKRCACGEIATHAYCYLVDNASQGVQHFCDGCAESKRAEIALLPHKPRSIRGRKALHGEFGRSNSDVSSGVASSIPNWGSKIKARQA